MGADSGGISFEDFLHKAEFSKGHLLGKMQPQKFNFPHFYPSTGQTYGRGMDRLVYRAYLGRGTSP